ncbi:MAG: hypothetical protein LRS46_00295 [Desulfurococcales archaeon]|nr:hypothetical protein [Desulfurococcales archaeon]
MQTSKTKIRKPLENELKIIKKFLYKTRLHGIINLNAIFILDIEGAIYYDCFEINEDIYKILNSINRTPYSLGFYIGSIDPERGFKPSLPLAFRACRLCRVGAIPCYILPERQALRFTYGRCLKSPHLGGDASMSSNSNIAPVLSEEGYCLGWGHTRLRASVKYLCPLVDLGWYLRRGG